MRRIDGANLLKRRLKEANIVGDYSPHSFRATGITTYLENGETLEVAQRIAGHAGSRYKVIRPAWTEGPHRGYGIHPVLRYSVIPSAEHDTALLGKQRSAFIFHCGVIIAAASAEF
jgi:hypothetical protein